MLSWSSLEELFKNVIRKYQDLEWLQYALSCKQLSKELLITETHFSDFEESFFKSAINDSIKCSLLNFPST